jgi:hypothetical protein
MKRRLVFLAICILAAGLDLPRPFAGRLSARDVPPVVDPFFLFFPSPDMRPDVSSFPSMRLAPGTPTTTFAIEGGGRVIFFDPRTGQTIQEIQPFGSDFHDPLAFTLFSRSGGAADTFMVGPALPSDRPMHAYQLTTPPTLLGEIPDEWMRTGGLRIAAGDVDGDRRPELVVASGKNGPGSLGVVPLTGTQMIGAGPFGPDFRGGIYVTTGDLNRDGRAEILATTETDGGELLILDVAGGILRVRARGFPFGTDFRGGIRGAIGDVNADGFPDILVAPVSGPPRIRGFSLQQGQMPTPILDFFAFDPAFTGGVFVSTGFIAGHPLIVASSASSVRAFRPDFDGSMDPVENFVDQELLVLIAEFKRDLNLYLASHTGAPQ